MITFFDAIGPALWRATWQAAVLAMFVVLVLRLSGERLAPRWRYLLWSVVLIRLLCVATPASPWSAFNLLGRNGVASAPPVVEPQNDPSPEFDPTRTPEFLTLQTDHETRPTTVQFKADVELPRVIEPVADRSETQAVAPVEAAIFSSPSATVSAPIPSSDFSSHLPFLWRIVTSIWLVGCLWCGLQLIAGALVLRRRLSACRPVTDADILNVLETSRRQIGLKRCPALLVTPEAISPCLVGLWRPRIVLPESILTESSMTALRHVLAHELSHLVRGDIWTNWLLLSTRILHWFNPLAWWTICELHAEREAACDELAIGVLGQANRAAYASTLITLASTLSSAAIAPAMVGLVSSARRLRLRIERLLHYPAVATFRPTLAAGLLLGIGLLGLTDSMPGVVQTSRADQRTSGVNTAKTAAPEQPFKSHAIKGRCVDTASGSPLPGVQVRLYEVRGLVSPAVMVAVATSDAKGEFAFQGLTPPRYEERIDHLDYGVLAFADNRPTGITSFHFDQNDQMKFTIRINGERSNLTGRIVDERGQPVRGATVLCPSINGRPIAGIGQSTTDKDGKFELEDLATPRDEKGGLGKVYFTIQHPDYLEALGQAIADSKDVSVTLKTGCIVTGSVIDRMAQKQTAGVVVHALRIDEYATAHAVTDAAGKFRLIVPEGRYHFYVEAQDRVSEALTDQECLIGKPLTLPPFKLTGGGFIAGRVLNTATGKPISVSERGQPIEIGLYGPSIPTGRAISPMRIATVDANGRFVLRAAPGENFPYLVNIQGQRMAWDTGKQPPILVQEGETTAYDMLITPPLSTEEKLQIARKIVAQLPQKPTARTAQIIIEFRKLNHTVDETETWCMLMRELVAVGRDAVPQLCAELDRTTENRMLRRLGFALRAIGDPRAVPALIRAIPKTLLPSCSDYGLLVGDADLLDFMRQHDLNANGQGTYFDLGRPVREIFGALQHLTGQNFDDLQIFSISRSDDPRRQLLQKRLFVRQARQWQTWWEAHWRERTDDVASQKVKLIGIDEALPPVKTKLGPTARLGEGLQQAILSPAIQEGLHAWHFYDLDTGYRPKWPAHIPQDEARIDPQQLATWATENGIDLMCMTHRSADGKETFVLRSFGLKAWEIGPREVRNFDKMIAAGTLPEGRNVGELLMHYESALQQFVPDANAAFIFITREGSQGLIETTDRIVRTADLTGVPSGSPSGGVGLFKGVQFNLKSIIP